MMKKPFMILTICSIFFSLVISGCTQAKTGEETAQVETIAEKSPAEEVITLSFWHTYSENSPENDTLVNTLIPIFEEEHPNIKVETLIVPWEDFRSKLYTSIAGGVAPDLARIDIIWVPEFAEMGALVALDENIEDFQTIADQVFSGPLSTNAWNGHYYGLPLDTNTKAWFYNKAMYEAADILPPTSFDEMLEQCEAIKAVYPDSYYFATDGTFAWVTLPWIWSFGGSITDDAITTATGYLNGPGTVAAYESLLQLYNNGCIAPVILGSGIDVFTGYAQDNYASLDNGPWTFSIIESQFPDKEVSVSAFPAGPGGSINVVGGEDVVLFEKSKNKEAALEFMRFLLSEEYQLKMAEVGQIPVLKDAVNSDYMQNHPYYTVFLEQLTTSKSRTSHPKWEQMDQIITDAGQLILRGEKSVQEALDEAAAEIDILLQE
ncbi:MAG TPA: extracellular solute-binding protein [Anaerolineaceae bacterium]|nr:extracellular solute-binding protein [Anaerolineaceae bacterium]